MNQQPDKRIPKWLTIGNVGPRNCSGKGEGRSEGQLRARNRNGCARKESYVSFRDMPPKPEASGLGFAGSSQLVGAAAPGGKMGFPR
jgi:hypothetical protein